MAIDYGVWVARLVLAAVFGLSAWGKFADPPGTRKAVGEFGIPLRLIPTVGRALPLLEAVIALALLPRWTAAAAALISVGLLAAFTGAVARLLRQGKHPACSCFGAASSAPIGTGTLVRNGVLMLLSLVVAVGSVAYPRVPAALPAEHAVGMAVAAVFAMVLVWLWGELRSLRRRLDEQALSTLGGEGLPTGAVAPEFDLLNASGAGSTSLESLLAPGRSVLLVFVHPSCEMCAALARELPRWQLRRADAVTIAVVGNGADEPHAEWARTQGLGAIPMLVQQGNEASLRYRVRGTPSGVLIAADGRIAAPVARGAMAVRDLLMQTKRTGTQLVSQSNGQQVFQAR
ncbi:MauE/DoxX family redox-associated membrane protein [Nocardia sp. SYP-A9097]|uniref:MauE/DoxX family redox-associated membrane protein n=1 Tax=Nocardia sp. SYP-A9097 TaxID=2663237 RepID=UPI001890DE11|nr:MauE/DoxX family redox-associated membrane protein [Nocardia sp. SYP-A9097]